MDVAKYVGLFLHKNQYCYLPNLGNFEVKRKPAHHQGQSIEAPEYDVTFKFASGAVDDALANYIAIEERVSIANAANAIRNFSAATKQALENGEQVVIPGFGKFVRNGSSNEFVSDQHIQIQTRSIPIFKSSSAQLETMHNQSIPELHQSMQLKEPKNDEEIIMKRPRVDWGKVFLVILIIGAVLAAIAWAIYYFYNNRTSSKANSTNKIEEVSNTKPADTAKAPIADTAKPNTTAALAHPSSDSLNYAILNYTDKTVAEKRVAKLKSYGNNVRLVDNGSGTYLVVLPVSAAQDTTAAKDSLRKFFNPKGSVTIMK